MKARHLFLLAAVFAAAFVLWIEVATPAPAAVETQAQTMRPFGT